MALAGLFVVLTLGTVAGLAGPASADGAAPVQTEPAANAVVASPTQVTLQFAAPVDGAGSSFTVLAADGSTVASGPLAASTADPNALVGAVANLPNGVYTVVWSTGGAAPATGAIPFDVDPTGAKPKTVSYPKAVAELKPVKNVLVAWMPWITIMTFVGALMLRFVVTGPVVARIGGSGGEALEAGTDRRLVRVAALAIALFLPATVVQLAYEAGGNTHAAFGKIGAALGADGDGHVWFFRLVVTVLAVLVVVPAAITPGRFAGKLRAVMLAGLVLGMLELVARVVPTAIPPNKPRTLAGDLFTFGHIAGAAVWIGGLVGIVALAFGSAVTVGERGRFWPPAIKRFSLTALGCVGAVVLSGLWLYWVHVASISQLGSTLYGRTLLVKLIGVTLLVLLGAVNHLWLRPRLDARYEAGDDSGIAGLVRDHFRAVVAVEVVLGLAVLLAVPYLSGSSRNQAFQKQAADISQTTVIEGGIPVGFKPSGLQPGLVDYQVVTPAATRSVALTFSSDKLGIPAQTVTADKVKDGLFQASGFYAGVAGPWNVSVALDGLPQTADFHLPIKAEPAKLARSTPPKITGTFWFWAVLEVLVVVGALYGASRLGVSRARKQGERLDLRDGTRKPALTGS